ncbi:MAG: hypothetical protein ACYCYD_05225 [Acidimicrobiales bacterium]
MAHEECGEQVPVEIEVIGDADVPALREGLFHLALTNAGLAE